MSQFVDKQLKCVDCNADFTFTVGEQEYYQEKGFINEPKRCSPCRQAKKAAGGGGYGPRGGIGGGGGGRSGGGGPREMFTTICATCGGEARVPFQPRGDRPVYCSNCFDKKPSR